MYGPTPDQGPNSIGRNSGAVHNEAHGTMYDSQNTSVPRDEVSSKVLDVFEEITSGLSDLLREFEGLRFRLTTDRSLESANLGVSLQAKLTDSLSNVQAMADQLQLKIEPMQELVAELKCPTRDAQVQLSGTEMLKVLQLLAELRSMCQSFAGKLHELRSLTSEALEVTRRRFRQSTKTITIDCSALVVVLMLLVYVWVSKQFAKWHSAALA